jgi:hypothetical protein
VHWHQLEAASAVHNLNLLWLPVTLREPES